LRASRFPHAAAVYKMHALTTCLLKTELDNVEGFALVRVQPMRVGSGSATAMTDSQLNMILDECSMRLACFCSWNDYD
jgi:hypothetical protein